MWAKVERLAMPELKHLRFRHPPPPFVPLAALVRGGAEGGARRGLHRHSNVLLAMDNDLEALGTNAHDCHGAGRGGPQKPSCKPRPTGAEDWQCYYGGNLLIVLPDSFGTASFLRDAPDWVADWTGFRPDTAPAIEGGEKIMHGGARGRDPREKLLIFSDGLDVHTIEGPTGISRGGCAWASAGAPTSPTISRAAPRQSAGLRSGVAGGQSDGGQRSPGGQTLGQSGKSHRRSGPRGSLATSKSSVAWGAWTGRS